jgi:hypothetical protein
MKSEHDIEMRIQWLKARRDLCITTNKPLINGKITELEWVLENEN